MYVLWACVIIGLIVFGAMAYAIFKFRKSKGAVPAQFTHNMTAEIIWTTVPVLILIGLCIPATQGLMRMYDTRDSEITVKVTGYQWMWKYEYLGEDVAFTSRLDRKSDQIRQSKVDARNANHPHYLLDVDNQLVLPVGTKVRFVLTADDVIVTERPREGWSVVNEQGETVALDLELTPELLRSGMAREAAACQSRNSSARRTSRNVAPLSSTKPSSRRRLMKRDTLIADTCAASANSAAVR